MPPVTKICPSKLLGCESSGFNGAPQIAPGLSGFGSKDGCQEEAEKVVHGFDEMMPRKRPWGPQVLVAVWFREMGPWPFGQMGKPTWST